ncbi:MAG: iron-sulfur cluster assembly accessory protein [Gammaproteobacteria bacterium]|jgi:iron-sulfur cluster assembly protein|nr:iron-sulfur cluster assembly accessory protein [Gammaproteobacteria bacterium]
MTITLTDAAAERLNELLAQQQTGVALRLGVTTSGCSGFAYTMDFADAPGEDDEVFEDHGIRLLVDRQHVDYLDGMQVDFVRDGLNRSFQFSNPNVTATCGCGESFAVS